MNKYTIDQAKFMTYLKTIQPDSSTFVFQTFTDNKAVTKVLKSEKKRDPLACSFVATPEEALPRLQLLQSKGAGVFVQMNVSNARGKDNVTKLSSYFLDTDGAPVAPIIKAMPKPLMVVESSKGNYHIYWRTIDALEKFKATQKSLALSFECDVAMVNLDRVVRIPGSWHLKDMENPFQVQISIGEENIFTAADLLSRAPAPKSKSPSTTSTSMTDAMITTGEGFELPDKLASGDRTHHLIGYAGLLVNQGYSAEDCMVRIKATMLELLPAGDTPIPDHILEQEIYPSIHNFISRDNRESAPVIPSVPSVPVAGDVPDVPGDVPEAPADWASSAAPEDLDDLDSLGAFLERFYYVEVGSRIIHIKNDAMGKEFKLDEFKNTYGNKKRGKTVLTKSWMECNERKTVRDIKYHPGEKLVYTDESNEVMINNYKGNNLKVIESAHPAQVQPFLDHVTYMFPNQQDAHVFMSWMATSIKHPARRIPWAPFIVSVPGVGKGWVAELLKHLVGYNNFATIGPKDIKDGFNEFMFEKTILVIDELKTNGRDQFDMVETLKPMITEPHIAVNIKFGVKGTYATFVNILCFSNHTNAIPIDDGDRRFWVYRVLAKAKGSDYYDKLFQWLSTDGPAHLYTWLMKYSVGELNMNGAPPMTAAKREMIKSFKSEVEILLTDAIEDRVGPFIASVVSRDVMESYVSDALGGDKLSSVEKTQIKMFRMNKCSEIEGNDKRIRVTFGANTKMKQYPVIVRDADRWVRAETEDIVAEMKRAWMVSLGQTPGTNLSEVKDEPSGE